MNAKVQSERTGQFPIGVIGLAFAASIALHYWLVTGVQALRPATYEQPFHDRGVILECPLANCGPERLFRWPAQPPATDDGSLYGPFVDPLIVQGRGQGWAIVRCEAVNDHTFGRCRWIDESAAGFGDRALGAVYEARPTRRLEPGSTVQMKVSFE